MHDENMCQMSCSVDHWRLRRRLEPCSEPQQSNLSQAFARPPQRLELADDLLAAHHVDGLDSSVLGRRDEFLAQNAVGRVLGGTDGVLQVVTQVYKRQDL